MVTRNKDEKMCRYEIHFHKTPKELLIPIEETFYEFDWEMGFAVTKYYIMKTVDSIVIKFIPTKPFDLDGDQKIANNLLYVLVGKEQFFSKIYYECLEEDIDPDEMDIYFMSNEKSHKVLLDKYSEMYV